MPRPGVPVRATIALTADDGIHSFTAALAGTLDRHTGTVRRRGVTTSGRPPGSAVELAWHIDPAAELGGGGWLEIVGFAER